MLDQKRAVFRKESLERLSSPDRLDQLMQVVSPRSWLPLAAVGSFVIIGIVWSIYGRIPITIEGKGVLIFPRKVVPLESKSSGQLVALNLKVGDVVKKGQVIGTLDQEQLRKQLQQQQAKLAELTTQNQAVSLLQGQGSTSEKNTIQQQRQNALTRIGELQVMTPVLKTKSLESIQKQNLQIQERIRELQALTPVLKKRSQESLIQQSQSLNKRIKAAQAQLTVLKEKVDAYQRLLKEKVITQYQFYDFKNEYLKKAEEIAQLETELKGLEVKDSDTQERYINNQNEIARNFSDLKKLEVEKANAQEAYLRNLNEISQQRATLKDLDSREANLAKQNLQDSTSRINQIQEVKREIAKLELELSNNSEIISKYSGRILEITVTPGQVINAGTRLGNIEAENSSAKLVSITYFPVAEGKKIQTGMSLQVTPQTVKRERFGGIVATTTSVSGFPITKEAAASVVGNSELVSGLVSDKQEGVIQVYADLALDSQTFSGYKWSSSTGPQTKISSGTTTLVRVKVEERAPITFVLPILREYSGIY
jgi:HlyD family secretion protein